MDYEAANNELSHIDSLLRRSDFGRRRVQQETRGEKYAARSAARRSERAKYAAAGAHAAPGRSAAAAGSE